VKLSSARAVLPAIVAVAVCVGAARLPAQQERPHHAAARLEYFYSQRRFPFALLPAHFRRTEVIAPALSGAFLSGPNTSSSWTALGPAPINNSTVGRVTSLAVDPTTPSTIYLGAAQGGIWKTTNTGGSWVPLTDNQCSLATGAVTLDPLNSSIVYVGTGEEDFSGDSYYGCGILKSSDGGATWATLGSSIFDTPTGGAYIGRVHIPAGQGSGASSVIYAATSFGLYRSADAGASWAVAPMSIYATDVITDPSNASVVYAAAYNGGIYKSTNAGASYTQLGGGLPTASIGRIALAISPSAPQTVYALIANISSGTYLGLFKSTDAGSTWTQLNISAVNCSTYCWYMTMLTVDPTNTNNIYVGGISLYASTDGGASFTSIGNSIHADQHALVFDPTNPAILFSGNDGGINRSTNSGGSWSSLNTNLSITQFYPGISMAPSGPNPILGGAQDNGTLMYTGSSTWNFVLGGDGGFTATNPVTPSQTFAEFQWGQGNSGPYKTGGGGYSAANTGINQNDNALFIPPFVMDPQRPATLYFGTHSLYRTANSGGLWTVIPAFAPSGLVAAIGLAASDTNTHYVGTNSGELFVTTNGGASYTSSASGLPGRAITWITVHRSNPMIAYVSVSGFQAGHVFKTINGGGSWSDISGNLPDVPVNAIALLPDGELDIGTDLGVYRSTNDGSTWAIFSGGLPNVAVLDLQYQSVSSTLVAATHGRGMWSATVTVIAPAVSLALDLQPGSGASGAPLGTQPVVSIRTGAGDRVSGAVNTVTAALNVISGSGTLSGTTAVAAVNGVATFTNLKVTGSGTFTITFTSPGLTSITSNQFTVSPGATKLAIATQPSAAATNGVAFSTQPVIQLQDGTGTVVAGATNQVTASLNTVSGAGTLGGTLTVTAVNGVATFTNLKITGTGTLTVTLAATGLTSATSANVVVAAGAASTLALTTQPAGAVNGVAFTTQPVVAIQDAFGAIVTTATNAVTASLNTISGSGTLGGTLTVSAVNGVATFTNLKITGTGTFTVTFAATGLTSVTSGNVVVVVGAAFALALTTQPGGAVNGVAFTTQPAVAIQDAFGATVATATNSVTASLNTISGSGTLGGTLTVAAVNGIATFTNLKITGAGTFTVTFAATGLTGVTSGNVVVVVGAASALALTTPPAGAVNGVAFTTQPAVAIQDAFGATVATATNSVTASLNTISGSGTLGGTLTVAAVNGIATFTNLKITGAGTFTVTFAATGLASAASGNLIVTAGAPTTLALTTQPAGAVNGVAFTAQPVIQIQDGTGLLVPSATNAVTASLNVISGSGTLGGTLTVAAVNGVATFANLKITGIGTFTLTFAATGLASATSGSVVVVVGAASTLALTTQPAGAVNGVVLGTQPVIAIQDAFGATVMTATNQVTASLNVLAGSGTLSGTVAVAAVNGVTTFTNLKISGAGTFTVTFAATGLASATSGNLIVAVGAPTTLVLATQPAGAVNGVAFTTQPVIQIQDGTGLLVPSATNTVTASLSTVSGSGTLGGTVTVAAVNGVATFTNLKISGTGTFTLTFAATGLTSATSANVVVVVGAAATLALTTQPAGGVNGAVFTTQPVVAIEDAFGATVTTATNAVTASLNTISGSGTLGGTLTVAAVNGVATFTNLKITGTGTFTVTFAAAGLASSTSGTLVVAVGAPTTLVLTTPPAGAVDGVVFTTQPVVQIRDGTGLLVSTATNQVTASLNTISGAGTLGGTLTVTAVNGVATFTNLKITGLGTYAVTFAATGLTSATSGNVVVVVGAASTLVLTTSPTGAVNGAAFVTQPIVTIEDPFGATVTTATNAVTASLNVVSGSGALGGTVTVTAVNGVATFTNLAITGTGTFTLTFAATGLAGTTSGTLVVAVGAPAILAVTTQPAGGINGIGFGTQPVVQIRDGTGLLVPSATNVVTASLNVLSGSGTLGGTVTVAAVNGIATFTNLKITGIGTFTLSFAATGLASTTSGVFVVAAGAPTALVLTTQPGGGANGLVLTTQPVVAIQDALGAIVATATNQVTASLNVLAGSGTLSGIVTVAAVNGVATFTNLKITGLGTFTLTFAASGLTGVTSASVVVAVGAATKLGMVTQPGDAQDGLALATQPAVEIEDASGTRVTTAAGQISATLNILAGSGTLSAVPATVVNGVATFNNLSVAGTGTFTLTFVAPGVASVVSSSFVITPALATALAVTTSPAGAATGVVFQTQPVIEIRDVIGRRVSTAANAVTVSISSGSGVLSGTLTVPSVGGVATFTDLAIIGAGLQMLRFTADALATASVPLLVSGGVLHGDVNGDGQIQALDAQLVLQALVGLPLPAGVHAMPNGDADCNGTLQAIDAQIILASLVGIDVSKFCVGKVQ
jgi:hypothetical protein